MDVILIAATGIVDNVICADSIERAGQFYPGHTCIERTEALAAVGPGHTYDAVADTFTAPPEPTPAPLSWPSLEFLRRIPAASRIAMRGAAKTDPVMEDGLGLLDRADMVQADDPDLQRLLGYCVAQGHLTAQERDTILGG